MIDDYSEVVDFISKMEKALPIPLYPPKAFVHSMREKGMKIKPKREVSIEKIFYLGDEGGIMCAVKNPGKENIIVSLTHLHVKANHPLAKDIRAYQMRRKEKLS